MIRQSSFFGFDVILFVATFFLMITGIIFVYSSGVTATGEVYSFEYTRQIVWVATGLLLMFFFAFFNYNHLRGFSLYAYLVCLCLLFLTLIIGREVHGARSWLGAGELGIQPSEFMKIATILLFANYMVNAGSKIKKLPYVLMGLGICILPVFIILLQPDMGTALVYIPIFLLMAFLGGVKIRYLLFCVIAGFLTIVIAILPRFERLILGEEFPVFSIFLDINILLFFIGSISIIVLFSLWGYLVFKKRYFYWLIFFELILMSALVGSLVLRRVLKEYQVMRLLIFLNPYIEPRGSGWNIIQSITAIGSGGFTGKGFLMGTQSHYNYLPQQSTDFIFSIIAEEWGFIGGFFVISMFLVIILRGLRILTYARDDYARLIGAGVIAMFLFHVVVNIGMTMGIMPVSGIPLFFLSHGGSSLWTASIGLGILLNIYMRRYRY